MTAETAGTALTPDPADVARPGPAELRQAMGMFASGVTVITGIDDGEAVGFACQAFASVSLEPPLILFCADRGSRTWPRIRKSGRFSVNVLGEEQSDLCGRFGSSKGRKYDGLDWELSRWGIRLLRDAPPCVHAVASAVHVVWA